MAAVEVKSTEIREALLKLLETRFAVNHGLNWNNDLSLNEFTGLEAFDDRVIQFDCGDAPLSKTLSLTELTPLYSPSLVVFKLVGLHVRGD